MINYTIGNVLESDAQALVNTVNTVGVMGKGIALQFKKAFPNNFKAYADACRKDDVEIGRVFVTKDENLSSGKKWIINFPTKKHWRKPSEYKYIEDGLDDLRRVIETNEITSIAIPPLGAGNGGLEWEQVKKLIDRKLNGLDANIIVYEPTAQIKEYLKKERVKLTDARALLLYVLYDLVKNGEYVSEFSSEKVCYFLQRFGAEKHFKLTYHPNFYGPYSGKVRFLLNKLNGSYLMGFSDMNKKPFDPLTLVADGYETVVEYVENRADLNRIAQKTTSFLSGFYSDFSLELMSSVDHLISTEKSRDPQVIMNSLSKWNDRKRSIFYDSKYVVISLQRLQVLVES